MIQYPYSPSAHANWSMPDKEVWKQAFLGSEKWKKIQKAMSRPRDIDVITWTATDVPAITPRERYLASGGVSLASFYAIDVIHKAAGENTILDVGCGCNLFKDAYPVIGLDKHPRADIFGYFDHDFVSKNQNKYSAAIAINSLHFLTKKNSFSPMPISEIPLMISWFSSVLKQGGLGYFTFNTSMLLEFTPADFKAKHALTKPDTLSQYILDKVKSCSDFIDVIFYEDIIDQMWDEMMDGNIRIMFRKIK